MTFLAMGFPAYFGALLLACWLMPEKGKRWVLLAGSWLFYLRSGREALAVLLLVLTITLLAGKWKQARIALPVLLGILLLFKARLTVSGVALPAGLSFYTFQCLGYLLDQRGKASSPDPGDLALSVSFFPQMVQGPVVRYRPSPAREVRVTRAGISLGLQRMLWGYFKKLVVADRLVTAVTALREMEGGAPFLLLSFVYGIRIYADFTGGMDIALGAAECFGIRLPENFDHPFLSKSVAEFWRRWHITLGAWMKTYVFYPVCVSAPLLSLAKRVRGRNPGLARKLPVYIATILTWLATGLWHGLTPNFWLWGLTNGMIILLSQELEPWFRKLREKHSWMKSRAFGVFQVARTLTLMNLVRLWDLYPDPGEYLGRIAGLLSPGKILWSRLGLAPADWAILAVSLSLMAAVSALQLRRGRVGESLAHRPALRGAVNGALVLAVLLLGCYGLGYEGGAFIYDQF